MLHLHLGDGQFYGFKQMNLELEVVYMSLVEGLQPSYALRCADVFPHLIGCVVGCWSRTRTSYWRKSVDDLPECHSPILKC